MELRTVRRGLVTLAIAALLGLAGAYPASAAEERGWLTRSLSWLSALWAGDDSPAESRAGEGLVPIATKGYGVDPNGLPVPGETPPAEEGN
jgi:hypothetical protein